MLMFFLVKTPDPIRQQNPKPSESDQAETPSKAQFVSQTYSPTAFTVSQNLLFMFYFANLSDSFCGTCAPRWDLPVREMGTVQLPGF